MPQLMPLYWVIFMFTFVVLSALLYSLFDSNSYNIESFLVLSYCKISWLW